MSKCKACDNTKNNRCFEAREMMFGFRDEFTYCECSNCGSLQVAEIPRNLSKYYPPDYYSFTAEASLPKRLLKGKRASHALGEENVIGRLLVRWYGIPDLADWVKWLNIDFDQAILDVGCGAGHLLLEMHHAGFSNLTGIDAYIEEDIHYKNGVVILKRTLDEVDGAYALIMLHHSFEHMPEPLETLKHMHRLLQPGGFGLLRLPVSGSYAWRVYGVDWVQLDAPRHLFLPTEEGLRILIGKAGLEVVNVIYDSTDLQFWGSEQYKRDIPLRRDKRSLVLNPRRSIFTKEDLRGFRTKAENLNANRDGDQACFYLRRSNLSST